VPDSPAPRKRRTRGGRRGNRARLEAKINAKATDRMVARTSGGKLTRSDGTVVTVESLTIELDGDKGQPGLWDKRRRLGMPGSGP
jgi:hypothetical protein